MKKHFLLIIAAIVLMFSFYRCAKKNSEDPLIIEPQLYPNCVKTIIDSSLASPKGSVALVIYRGIYKNALIYYIIAGCCDRYNPVYDANCNYLFSPSGGITGGGDNTHPDFFKYAILDTTAIWKDPR